MNNDTNSGVNTILIVVVLLILVGGGVWFITQGTFGKKAADTTHINVDIPGVNTTKNPTTPASPQ